MNRILNLNVAGLLGRMMALLVPAALFALLLPSGAARADLEMGLDIGTGRDHEGDPLDTNDTGGDDGSGDDLHDTAGWSIGGRGGLDRILRSSRVLLVPRYNGATLTFKLFILPQASDKVEARHAK